MPAILVALFSDLLFYLGVRPGSATGCGPPSTNPSWTSPGSYLEEHQQAIRGDILSMASDLNRGCPDLGVNPTRLQSSGQRAGAAALAQRGDGLRSDGQVLARTGITFALGLDPKPPIWRDRAARDAGEVAILTSDNDDRVRALVA